MSRSRLDRLRWIEAHLLPLVLVTAVLGVAVPPAGTAMAGALTPLLALLMLCTSLSFDLADLRRVLRRPGVQALATALVYGPMALIGAGLGLLVFGGSPVGLGLVLVGVLPTDVSSPLMVWIARGDVALATVLNAVNTAVSPLLVPLLFLALTGLALDVPVVALVGELALVVLVPTVLGATLRTWRPGPVERIEPLLSATASLAYLALLLAVVGPNAGVVQAEPVLVAAVAVACLALNAAGYGLAVAAGRRLHGDAERVALLFTVSKKEFTIAAVVVAASDLPVEVALPAAVYAVVQMVTSPLVARRLAAREPAGATR